MDFNEIETAVGKAKSGDMEAVLSLIEQFKPFIFKQARTLNVKNMDTYDLVQTGYVALIKAVDLYKIGNHKFSCYVYRSIKNNIKYALRTNSKTNSEVSLNAPIACDETSSGEFIDIIDSDYNLEEYFFKNERRKELKKLLSKLQEDELELIIMCYYNGFTLKKYAEKKGLNYLTVVRFKNKILKELKTELEKQP